MPKGVTRLFQQFQPEHYDLTLDLNEEALTFTGQVIITGKKVGRPSKRLTFHQKDLNIDSAKLTYVDKKKASHEIPVSRINTHKAYDEVRLHSDSLLMPGEYKAQLSFSGQITQAMHGIYPCFFDHDGKKKKLIASQFESHHAREAFPCIDEPEAKAKFDLTLITAKDQMIIGNTPLKSQSDKDGRLVSAFETSPLMATYLLAFVVGELQRVSAKTKDGVEVSSWATVAQPKDHLNYANQEAVDILEFFTDYFQTPFPLPKLDNVALPDFEALAMENWGLITYREAGLLADPHNRSIASEQLITTVIAHEVSHQWFGNLVTMKWWNELWLNESFAALMENVAPDALHPEWQAWEDFTSSRVLSCSHRDIYKDVQPVGLEDNHPDEIAAAFDPSIVYAKGARLLSMLLEFIGEDNFRDGLKTYFEKHAYSNTVGDDLWEALSASSGQDVKSLMTPWIKQPGQPLITVKPEAGKLELSQKRFLMDGEDKASLWPVPLLADPPLETKMLDTRSASIDYSSDAIPLLNAQGNGHFIAYYDDPSALSVLKQRITKRQVSSSSRIILLSDMLLLARAGNYGLTELLDIVKDSNEEPRDAVWTMLARITGQAQILTDDDKAIESQIRKFKAELSAYWYSKLGWVDQEDDDANTKHLRTTALALSLAGEYKPAVETALQLYDKARNAHSLPAEQRALIVAAVTKRGVASDIKALKAEYESSNNPDVQMSIASGLCATRDPKLAEDLIKWGLSKDGAVRPQDIATWFAYLMRNPYTREVAWSWMVKSWDYLADVSGGGKYMEYFIWYSAGPLANKAWLKKFKDFFTPLLKEPALKRNILIAFSEIEARAAWREREYEQIKSYFSKV
jgi:aminopeptidase N